MAQGECALSQDKGTSRACSQKAWSGSSSRLICQTVSPEPVGCACSDSCRTMSLEQVVPAWPLYGTGVRFDGSSAVVRSYCSCGQDYCLSVSCHIEGTCLHPPWGLAMKEPLAFINPCSKAGRDGMCLQKEAHLSAPGEEEVFSVYK